MATDAPAVIAASIHTMRTLVDGTLSVTLQVEPRHANAWVQAFGTMPGTPVAVARLMPEAAQQHEQAAQQEPARQKGPWGAVYSPLWSMGWWHNPRVAAAFDVPLVGIWPEERIRKIKGRLYEHFGIESLSDLEPQDFVRLCEAADIRDTVPVSIREAAAGRPI